MGEDEGTVRSTRPHGESLVWKMAPPGVPGSEGCSRAYMYVERSS